MKVIFCIPGKTFSKHFLESWSELLLWCFNNNITPIVNIQYNAVIYYCRNQLLGADLKNGKEQKPFNGKIDYDYIMWLDSDMVFNPEHFAKLLRVNQDIVSGLYLMEGAKKYATVQKWDYEYFGKNYSFDFLTPDFVKNYQKQYPNTLINVEYTGFGFILIKKGVFEKLKYPWFKPIYYDLPNGIRDFCAEDVGFCQEAIKNGFKIYIEPSVILGHEKTKILYPENN